MENIKKYGFLFDLDGVLIDSEREYSRIWSTVNSEFPSGVDNLETKIKGCTLDKILDDYYPAPEIRERVVARLYEMEGKMRYRFLPGAGELLHTLKENGYKMALVTSSNDDKMHHLAEEIPNLMPMFDIIITADLISKSKPDPEGYLKGAALLGCDIASCVVFEDSLQGVKAGKASGALVVGVVGTLSRETLLPFSDILVNDLSEIDINELILKIDDKQHPFG